MNKNFKLAIIGALAGVGFYVGMRQKNGSGQNYLAEITNTVANNVGNFTEGFFMRVGNMKNANPADLNNANVKAFLRVIRQAEGTADANGYRRIFGGQLFTSYAEHPRIIVKKSGYTSTAAGAYQFIAATWDETKKIMGLKDFSPASQDLAALGRIVARDALEDVKSGNFTIAIRKISREWASLPYSPYGQPTITLATATNTYLKNGGIIKEMTA